jgi:hypothetical protein
MRLLYRRCAGLDVHKKSISVCVRIQRSDSKQVEMQEEVFGTFTPELERLPDPSLTCLAPNAPNGVSRAFTFVPGNPTPIFQLQHQNQRLSS